MVYPYRFLMRKVVEEENPNDETEPLTPQQKREVASIYFAVIAVVIIVASFFWHILSTLWGSGGN